jgi:hypothetical protein
MKPEIHHNAMTVSVTTTPPIQDVMIELIALYPSNDIKMHDEMMHS